MIQANINFEDIAIADNAPQLTDLSNGNIKIARRMIVESKSYTVPLAIAI